MSALPSIFNFLWLKALITLMWLESCCDLWPASPAPASSAVSLAALPGPRPHAASRSSAHHAAHSGYSSWGCPSSDQRCVPSDAEERCYSQSTFPSLKWRDWPFPFLFHRHSTLKKGLTKGNVYLNCPVCWNVGAHLPVLFQVSDLLSQLFQASQSLRLSQLHPYQLLLKTRHIGVIR